MGRTCQGAGPWKANALRGIHTSLMKQQGRKWGEHAKEQDPGKLMPCEEYILQDEYDYFFNSLAGDFAAGEWKNQDAEEWKSGCVADLRHRPPQVIRSHSLPHLGCLTYSPEHELYAASRAAGSGTIGPDETARAKMGRPCQGAGPWEADALRGIHTSG